MKLEKPQDPYNNKNREGTLDVVNDYLAARQRALMVLNPYRSEIEVKIKASDLPLRVDHVGDTHITHDASSIDGLQKAVEEANKNGSLMILQGNLLEGVSNKFLASNTVKIALTIDEQERLAKAILQQPLKEGRVIALGKNPCHEGWSYKTATHDPLRGMVEDDTPLLYTGGQVILKDERSGRTLGVIEAYHNSGKGRTILSPEGSVRARLREVPVGQESRPNLIVDAHMHMLVAGQEVMRNPVTRKDIVNSLGEVGADKGSKDNPDGYLLGIGVPPRNQPADAGKGLVTIWRRGDPKTGRLNCYPVADYKRADKLYDAMKLWDDAASTNGTLDDLKGTIYSSRKFNKPKIQVESRRSLVRPRDAASKSEGEAPLYKTLVEKVDTTLPISVEFIGNTRIGSSSFQRERLKEVIEEINENPWTFFIATRRLINQGVPMRTDRLQILQDLGETLAQGNGSLMAIMMTDDLQNNSWGLAGRGKEILYPGDWLYGIYKDQRLYKEGKSPVAGVPLIMPETVLFLEMNPTTFTLYLRDKLSHLASLINPEHGLTRIQQIWGIDADALIGGHTEVVGWRTWMRPWGQLEVVVPGGFSEYMEKGIGSRVDFPEGGQGVILLPEPRKMLYSFATHRDGRDMHEALLIQEGLRQLGMLDRVKEKIQRKK